MFSIFNKGYAIPETTTIEISKTSEATTSSTPDSRCDGCPYCTGNDERKTSMYKRFIHHMMHMITSHFQLLLVCLFIFVVLTGAGLSVCVVVNRTNSDKMDDAVLRLAEDIGKVFSNELELALLPLFSLAQFATELDIFRELPSKIGPGGEPGSLPYIPQVEGSLSTSLLRRNVTGVCDDPELIERFYKIAATIGSSTGLELNILQNFQLSPYGVICLVYPYNNTSFNDGLVFDASKAIGIDLLNDQANKYIAINSMIDEEVKVSIVGPKLIPQCTECGLYIVARLPVATDAVSIIVNGSSYPRWGFATLLIQWEKLINQTQQREKLYNLGYEFQLTRTDRIFNDTTAVFDDVDFVLAESENYGTKENEVSTLLQTSTNDWVMRIQYDNEQEYNGLVIAVIFVVGFSISVLVYCVLVQKQIHATIVGQNLAHMAKVDVERNITAYFAHELRNPLSAIDSALSSLPCSDPDEAEELLSSMKLCSSFMATIMNNLLDVRKLEEGKLILHSDPFSLKQVVMDISKMAKPTLRPHVEFVVEYETFDKDWVMGDVARINQILTNIVSNAIKYTLEGVITLAVGWDCDYVQFECRDTGPGIPKEVQSRMFERFIQRGGAPGSGLGLALVKQMVTLMGGTIRFDSDPTVKPGTNCIVKLPLESCDTPTTGSIVNTDIQPFDEPLRILIVDDIKMNRYMLKRRLQKDIAPQCEIVEASCGEDALKICETALFDVIVMDQYMEESGGVLVGTDVIIALRRKKISSVIIGCSGNDLTLEFKNAGADLVWSKPMPSNTEMILQLREHLQHRERELDSFRSSYKSD